MEASVSIVVPTHNRQEMLRAVIGALEKQTYDGEMEYVIVLDGCTDGTREMLSNLSLRRPTRAVELPGLGAAAARNRGASAATGEYLLFIDDDVIPSPSLVAEHMEWHRRCPGSAIVGACPFGLGAGISRLGQFGRDWWHAQYQLMAATNHKNTFRDFLTGNASLPRQVFIELGGFDESFRHAGREDFEFGLRLLEAEIAIQFNPEAYGHHYPADGFMRVMRRAWVHGKADVILARKHPSVLPFTDLATFRQQGGYVKAAVRWLIFKFPSAGGVLGWLASRWLAATEQVLPQALWLRLSRLMIGYNYWQGVEEQGFSPAELRRLAEHTWAADPANRRIKFVRQDLADGLREISEIENYSDALALVSAPEGILGWVRVRLDGGKTCIPVEEMARALSEQLGWPHWCRIVHGRNDAHPWKSDEQPITWDSLMKALTSSRTRIRRRSNAELREDFTMLVEYPCEREVLWAAEVERAFGDSEVAAVMGPVVPAGVDTRGDELLWEMCGLEGGLFRWPTVLNSSLSPARAALELDAACHWLAVRNRVLDTMCEEKADQCLPVILRRLLEREYAVVYHPGAVMWRGGSESREGFRRTLAVGRTRLGRFATRALLLEEGSRLDVLNSTSRWLRWRIKRGLKSLIKQDTYPITACAAEVFFFGKGMIGETCRILLRRERSPGKRTAD